MTDNSTPVDPTEDQETPEEQYVRLVTEKTDYIKETGQDRYSLGAWSYSKLKMFEKCPFQFYLKYILKVKLPEEIAANNDTTAADIGSSTHRILELAIEGKSLQESYAIAKEEFCPGKLTEEQWQENVVSCEYNITNFLERIEAFKTRYKVKKIVTELRMAVTKDWKPTTFFAKDAYFRGVIDLFILMENHDAMIIDHKHGPPASMGVRNFKAQLDTYKPLINYGYAELNGAKTGVHFIRDGEVVMDYPSTKEEIQDKLKTLIEWSIDGAIDSTKETGFYKHKRGPHCKYCEYDSMCKPGMLKGVEKSTKKFFEIKKVD